MQLRRLSDKRYYVDLEFIEDKRAASTSQGSVGLRLCSAYGEVSRFFFTIGLESALYTEYEEKHETFPGRLISKNSKDSECLDLVAGWLERCSRRHEYCGQQADVALSTSLKAHTYLI